MGQEFNILDLTTDRVKSRWLFVLASLLALAYSAITVFTINPDVTLSFRSNKYHLLSKSSYPHTHSIILHTLLTTHSLLLSVSIPKKMYSIHIRDPSAMLISPPI